MRAELAALELRRLTWRRAKRAAERVAEEFQKYDLLTYSSAIAFQVLYAVVPLLLLALAGLGLAGQRGIYTNHIAHALKRDLSPQAYEIANRTALRVLGSGRLWWATVGLLVTVWGVSGSLRAMMRALNGAYGARETRSLGRRVLASIGGAVVVIACVFAAAVVVLGGRLVDAHGVLAAVLFLARWLVALALLLLAIAAVIRLVPAKKRPVQWISIGSAVTALSWLLTSGAFAAYVSAASYTSFYGALATVVLLLLYLHLASIAFLFGVVVDSLLREEVTRSRRRRR